MKIKVVELVILNSLVLEHDLTRVQGGILSPFLDHHGQLFEVCSQNHIIDENESCRARDSEHSHFLVHLGQLFEVCSQNPTIDFESVSGGSEP